jgi:hypothetical protein
MNGIFVALLGIIILAGVYVSVVKPQPLESITAVAPSVSLAPPPNQPFLNTALGNTARQLFPSTSSTGIEATPSGYLVTTQVISTGATVVTINNLTHKYQSHQFEVQLGYKLYVVDTNINDDNESHQTDSLPMDDEFVMTDQNGLRVE